MINLDPNVALQKAKQATSPTVEPDKNLLKKILVSQDKETDLSILNAEILKQEEQVSKRKNLFSNFFKTYKESASTGKVAKAMDFGQEITVNPLGRTAVRSLTQDIGPLGVTGPLLNPIAIAFKAKSLKDGLLPDFETPFGTIKMNKDDKDFWDYFTEITDTLDVASLGGGTVVKAGVKEGIKAAAPSVGKAVSRAGQSLTKIPKEKLLGWYNLAKDSPEKVDELVQNIKENPTQPFFNLANKITSSLNSLKNRAQDAFKEAKDTLSDEIKKRKFNLQDKASSYEESLGEFGLKLEKKTPKTDLLNQPIPELLGVSKLEKTSKLDKEEISKIGNFIKFIGNTSDASISDVIGTRDEISKIYNSVPYGVDGKPRPFHALVAKLAEKTEEIIDTVLPDEFKEANKMYKDYWQSMKLLGDDIMRGGATKETAESFLSRIVGPNKGQLQENVKSFEDILEIDVLKEVELIKTAKELAETTPQTVRSRLMDFLLPVMGSSFILQNQEVVGLPLIGVFMLKMLTQPNVYRRVLESVAKGENYLQFFRRTPDVTEAEKSLLMMGANAILQSKKTGKPTDVQNADDNVDNLLQNLLVEENQSTEDMD